MRSGGTTCRSSPAHAQKPKNPPREWTIFWKPGRPVGHTEPVSNEYRTGKLCYVEIPADDVAVSSRFYADAFAWTVRGRGDGATAFDDTVGGVSGVWVTGRRPSADPGILIYVMVADLHAAMALVLAGGGEIVEEPGGDAPEITARFRDPAGNVLGLFQEPTLAAG
jgi:predicted enzyme related to lactoylglutathione lyase